MHRGCVKTVINIPFAYPLPTNSAEGMAVEAVLLGDDLWRTCPLQSNPDAESAAEVVVHLSKWLNTTLDHGFMDHSQTQGWVKRLGGS